MSLLRRVQAAAQEAIAEDAARPATVEEEAPVVVEAPKPKAKRATKAKAVEAPPPPQDEAPAAVEAEHPQEEVVLTEAESRLREALAELEALKGLAAGAGSVVIITGPVNLFFRREEGDTAAGFTRIPHAASRFGNSALVRK